MQIYKNTSNYDLLWPTLKTYLLCLQRTE